MKVLITGAKGMLGSKFKSPTFAQTLRRAGKIKEGVVVVETDADTMDITNAEATLNRIEEEKPDFVIHCAAYTKVDQAEEERELCYKINVTGTENIARASDKVGATLIYISTDFVFDGTSGKTRKKQETCLPAGTARNKKQTPYKETDIPNPLNYYGETKLLGERAVEKICQKYYIIRTAWLFGELPKGHPGSNFVETMLRLANEREELSVVSDQIGSPTYTGDLAGAIGHLIGTPVSIKASSRGERTIPFGIYHFSGEGETSWHGFAEEIFRKDKSYNRYKKYNKLTTLKPIPSSEYKSRAKRPPYSYLSKEKIKSYGVKIRPWQEMLTEYLTKR